MPFLVGFALGGYVYDRAHRTTPPSHASGLYTSP